MQSRGNFGLKFKLYFFSECPRETSPEASSRTAPLQNASFAQNFALQRPFAKISFKLAVNAPRSAGRREAPRFPPCLASTSSKMELSCPELTCCCDNQDSHEALCARNARCYLQAGLLANLSQTRKRQFCSQKFCSLNFCAPCPPLQTSKLMDFLLNFY